MLTTKNGFSIINKHLAKRRKSYQTAAVTGRSDEFPWTIGGSGYEEKYSRGRRGAPAKGVGRLRGAGVQIPPSPFQDFKNPYRVHYILCSELYFFENSY